MKKKNEVEKADPKIRISEPKAKQTIPERAKTLLQTISPEAKRYSTPVERKGDPKATPLMKGPVTGERSMSDGEFILTYGTEKEMKAFRQSIMERRARDSRTWITLIDGTKIKPGQSFFRCRACGYLMASERSESFACPNCNRRDVPAGGWMVALSDQDRDRYLIERKKKAASDLERFRQAGLFRRNLERAKQGLPRLTMDQFLAEQRKHSAMIGAK